jgi:N-methylhydantoinase A
VLSQFPVDARFIEKGTAELTEGVLEDLAADGIPSDQRQVNFEADLRFRRQVWEIPIPLPAGPLDDAAMSALEDAFRDEYGRRYGRGSIVLNAPIEFVSLRAIGTGRTLKATIDAMDLPPAGPDSVPDPVGQRAVWVDRGADGREDVNVHRADDLHPGQTLRGPALVDGTDTTIWVPEATSLRVSSHGTLIVEVGT